MEERKSIHEEEKKNNKKPHNQTKKAKKANLTGFIASGMASGNFCYMEDNLSCRQQL